MNNLPSIEHWPNQINGKKKANNIKNFIVKSI